MRRSLKFSCGKGNLRVGISRIARSYQLVNSMGSPHDAEIVRLLLVTALTADKTPRVETAIQYAVAVQCPMLAAEMGRRVTMRHTAMAGSGGNAYSKGGRWSHERRNQARVTLDNLLADALDSIKQQWQDEYGVVHDGQMVAEIAERGLRDPDLPEILQGYVGQTHALRQRLAQAEQVVNEIVDEAMYGAPMQRAG